MIISACQASHKDMPQNWGSIVIPLQVHNPQMQKKRKHNVWYNHVAATVPNLGILGQEFHAQRLGFDILCPTLRATLPADSIQHTATRTLRLGSVWTASEVAGTDTLPQQVGVFQE